MPAFLYFLIPRSLGRFDSMPNNYFISGMPKAGKTTLLRKLVEKMRANGLKVGGFLSPEEKAHGTRTGFYVEDIETGRIERLAEEGIDGPKVAKYHVDTKSFESLAVPVLEAAGRYDVIIIDEIGRMEMKSTKFGELLSRILESDTPVVAALSRDYIEDYKAWGEVQILTPSNRSRIYLDLLEKVMKYKKKKGARAKRKAAEKAVKGKRKSAKKAKRAGAAKSRGKRQNLDRMAEELLRHKAKRTEEAEGHEKKEERHPHHAKEERHAKEEKKEEKHEHKGRRHHVREWIREHVGV